MLYLPGARGVSRTCGNKTVEGYVVQASTRFIRTCHGFQRPDRLQTYQNISRVTLVYLIPSIPRYQIPTNGIVRDDGNRSAACPIGSIHPFDLARQAR